MATYAQAKAERDRLMGFQGVTPMLRKTGATTWELWVKDSRIEGENQVYASIVNYVPGQWLPTTVTATGLVIT